MRQRHLLYDQAREKLNESGLEERLAHEDPHRGEFFASDTTDLMRHIKELGYHDDDVVPEDFEQWRERANTLHKYKNTHAWELETPSGPATRNVRNEDLVALHGTWVADIFSRQEFWDHEQFGFDNHAAFMSAVYARIQENLDDREAHAWTSKHEGRTYKTRVGASMHGDLRINRVDITQHPVTEPTGLDVLVRPVTSEDEQNLRPYHSTETPLLASLLRYARQVDADAQFTNKAYVEDFITEVEQTPAYIGNFGDAGHGGTSATESAFFSFVQDIPRIGSEQPNTHTLHKEHGKPYELFIDEEDALAFVRKNEVGKGVTCLTLPPSETDELIKGLVYQAKAGQGRTSQNQILHGLRYQFSDELQARVNEFKQRYQ